MIKQIQKVSSLCVMLLLVMRVSAQSQQVHTVTTTYRGKTFIEYYNFTSTKNVHPDSVLGLALCCESFKDFPKEILKFKNLFYLDLANYRFNCNCSPLTKKEMRREKNIKRKLKKSKPYSQYSHTIPEYVPKDYFREKKIKSIPNEIAELKNLRFLSLEEINISLEEMDKLDSLLPNCDIRPSKEWRDTIKKEMKSKKKKKK